VSHKHDRDGVEKHKSCSFVRLTHELWRQRIVLSVICPLPTVRTRSRGFPQMGGCSLLKYNGGDSGNKISVLYWRSSLIRVSVIRGFQRQSSMASDHRNSIFHSSRLINSLKYEIHLNNNRTRPNKKASVVFERKIILTIYGPIEDKASRETGTYKKKTIQPV
jgi:hypothetical protein